MRKIIFSIDPGSEFSGYCVWNGETIIEFGKIENSKLLEKLDFYKQNVSAQFVIENIASYGLSVGAEVFTTCIWIGRYFQFLLPEKTALVFRREVKLHICGSVRAKDANIRQALIDRFEPSLQPKKRPCGTLKGLSADSWQAFALAVYYFDTFIAKK